MGRSVNYLNNAKTIIYFTANWLDEIDEDDNFDENMSQINWKNFYINLITGITNKLKSYYQCDEWDNRETKIFLKNDLCNIGISEYCGLYSLSVAPIDYDEYYCNMGKVNFAEHHAEQIEKSLSKILTDLGCTVLNKVGTFSNGNSVYSKV